MVDRGCFFQEHGEIVYLYIRHEVARGGTVSRRRTAHSEAARHSFGFLTYATKEAADRAIWSACHDRRITLDGRSDPSGAAFPCAFAALLPKADAFPRTFAALLQKTDAFPRAFVALLPKADAFPRGAAKVPLGQVR